MRRHTDRFIFKWKTNSKIDDENCDISPAQSWVHFLERYDARDELTSKALYTREDFESKKAIILAMEIIKATRPIHFIRSHNFNFAQFELWQIFGFRDYYSTLLWLFYLSSWLKLLPPKIRHGDFFTAAIIHDYFYRWKTSAWKISRHYE